MEDSFVPPEKKERKKANNSQKPAMREILTKAVCGSAQKNFLYSCEIEFDKEFTPNQILGTSITDFTLHPASARTYRNRSPFVTVNGTFDVNVWFSYNNGKDTEIARECVDFQEDIEITDFDLTTSNDMEARAVLTKTPKYKGAEIKNNNTIKVDVELGVYTEVIGETKIRVHCVKPEDEEDS